MNTLRKAKIRTFYKIAARRFGEKAARSRTLAAAKPSRQNAYERLAEVFEARAAKALRLSQAA